MLELKPLPYEPGALDKSLSEQSVSFHHDVLQAGYVKRFNDGKAPAFNGAGVELHELYWDNLCKAGEGGEAGECVKFIAPMVDAGKVLEGSGWVVLVWLPEAEQLRVLTIHNHQDGWLPGAVPLLVIDVWEHAYYLDYGPNRAAYLKAIWQNVDWNVVNQRFTEAVGSEVVVGSEVEIEAPVAPEVASTA